MTTTISKFMTAVRDYDVNTVQYVTHGAITSSALGNITNNTTGYDVNTVIYPPDGAIDSSGLGDGSTPLLTNHTCPFMNSSGVMLYDDSHDPISNATLILFNRLKATALIPSLFFIGFPGNILNLLVFFKHGLKQRINLCLFSLSLVDLVYLTFVFLNYVETMGLGAPVSFHGSIGETVAFIISNRLLGFHGFGWASAFISAIISSERCFCVIWPLRSSTLLKTRTMAVVIVVGVVLIAGGRFAVTEKYRVICLYDMTSGQERLLLALSRYYLSNKRLVDVLDSVVYGMVVPITTCSVVTVATVVTAVKLKKVAQWRQESSSALSPREIALTKMLIYLSIQFIVLNLPNILLRLTSILLPELNSTGRFANMFFVLTGVVEVCAGLNSSLNFLVYYFAGTKYRETVQGLCRKATTKKNAVYVNTSVFRVNTSL